MPDEGSSEGRLRALAVDLVVDDDRWNNLSGLDRIEALADAAFQAAEREVAASEVVVALSSDQAVRELNATYRGKDRPTNVLSFPAVRAAGSGSLGDVVLAYETCSREAGERGIPLADHACHLALHGVLHLLGYDHDDDADAEVMETLETRLLNAARIADPHSGGGPEEH